MSCSRYYYVSPGIKVSYSGEEGYAIGADVSAGRYYYSLLGGIAMGFEYTFARSSNLGNDYMQAYIGPQAGFFNLVGENDLLIIRRNGEYQYGTRRTYSLLLTGEDLAPEFSTSSERIISSAFIPFVSKSTVIGSHKFKSFGFILQNVYAYEFYSQGQLDLSGPP